MAPPHHTQFDNQARNRSAGLEVSTVCKEEEKEAVQTDLLSAGPSPSGVGRAKLLVCRQKSLSARALKILKRNCLPDPELYNFFNYSKDLIRLSSFQY